MRLIIIAASIVRNVSLGSEQLQSNYLSVSHLEAASRDAVANDKVQKGKRGLIDSPPVTPA